MRNFSFKSKFNIYRLMTGHLGRPVEPMICFSSFGALMRYLKAFRKTERDLPIKKRASFYIEGIYWDKTTRNGDPYKVGWSVYIDEDGWIDFGRDYDENPVRFGSLDLYTSQRFPLKYIEMPRPFSTRTNMIFR